MRKSSVLSLVLVASLFCTAARANPKEMLLCLPGFPGTQAQAQPYVDKMLRHLETRLEWPALSLTGLYLPDGEEALRQLAEKRPAVALVGPSIYASQRAKLGMKVIAQVEANGRGEETYSVLTRKDGPDRIEALEGKKLIGAVVYDPKFVFNVLFERKLKPGAIAMESEKRPLKALRDVVRGNADAAVVDQSVVDNLSTIEEADQLRVIFTAKPVPSPLVVVMGDGVKDAEKLKEVLVGLCEAPDGKALCESLTISSIKAASPKSYNKLLRLYGR